MSEQSPVVAACQECGRGYIYIQHERIRCRACGGPVISLPQPEYADDDRSDRGRWRKIVNSIAAPAPPEEPA